MRLRLVLRVVMIGLLVYVCIPLAIVAWTTVMLNIPTIPRGIAFAGTPILFFVLRFGLFPAVGYVAGARVTRARIANAALAGVLLAIGVACVDTIMLFVLPKRHPEAAPSLHVPSAGVFTSVYLPLVWFGLEVALAMVGGWIADRRVTSNTD